MLLYHESQVAALCGVHCLNTLLQGPYFNELDLAQIAQELDAAERAMLGDEALGGPGNLDESGMFSSQVLTEALSIWGLHAIPYDNLELRSDPSFDPVREAAFICNLQEHWFTLRQLSGSWYNFNSVAPAPELLSNFHLAAYLDSLKDQGYSVFVVRGPLPAGQDGAAASGGDPGPGRWFSPEEAAAALKDAAAARRRGRAQHAVEEALARAAQSGGTLTLRSGRQLGGAGGAAAGGTGDDVAMDEDPELAAAIAASLMQQQVPAGPSYAAVAAAAQRTQKGGASAQPSNGWQHHGDDDDEEEDPELAQALAQSLEEAHASQQQQQQQQAAAPLPPESPTQPPAAAPPGPLAPPPPAAAALTAACAPPPPPAAAAAAAAVQVPEEPPEDAPGAVVLALRLPSGQRLCRRFLADHTVQQVAAVAAQAMGLGSRHQVSLSTAFPPVKVLSNGELTLAGAGISDRSVLTVQAQQQ